MVLACKVSLLYVKDNHYTGFTILAIIGTEKIHVKLYLLDMKFRQSQ